MEIVITPQLILTVSSLLVAVGTIVTYYGKVKKKVYEPVTKLEEDVKHLKEKIAEHDTKLNNDYMELEQQKESNRIIMETLVALVRHMLYDGNEDELKAVEHSLNQFLIHK